MFGKKIRNKSPLKILKILISHLRDRLYENTVKHIDKTETKTELIVGGNNILLNLIVFAV